MEDLGIDRRVPILAGVAPVRSGRAARYMRDRVPGMEVPDAIIRRLDQAGPERSRREEEGIRICVEVIERLRDIRGLAGFHLMPIHWEEAVAEIARRADLVPARDATAPSATRRPAAAGAETPVLRDTREQSA